MNPIRSARTIYSPSRPSPAAPALRHAPWGGSPDVMRLCLSWRRGIPGSLRRAPLPNLPIASDVQTSSVPRNIAAFGQSRSASPGIPSPCLRPATNGAVRPSSTAIMASALTPSTAWCPDKPSRRFMRVLARRIFRRRRSVTTCSSEIPNLPATQRQSWFRAAGHPQASTHGAHDLEPRGAMPRRSRSAWIARTRNTGSFAERVVGERPAAGTRGRSEWLARHPEIAARGNAG